MIFPMEVSLGSKELMIGKSLDNAFVRGSFEKWIKKKKKVLFVVNDATRPTPTSDILIKLDKKMDIEKAKYIVATGAHKEPDVRELKFIFREFYERIKSNIIVHNARNKKSLAKFGTTEKGTRGWINKEVLKAKAIISIGSVEPHYFTGFTGGRKSFIPGLAGYATIEQNHRLALDDGTEPLRLEGNPVHLDLLDSFRKMPDIPIFSIQTVCRDKSHLCAIFCGYIHKSFSKACEYAEDLSSVSIKEKADIVITVMKPPLDRNLYQAHKAIEHGKFALKKGGTIILVAPCDDGIGPDNFYSLLSSSMDAEKILGIAKADYPLGYHKAARIVELSKKAEICVVYEIGDKILHDISIKPFDSLQEAINRSISEKGPRAKVFILMDGGNTVPVMGAK
jgi:nickel-dependent lactate racemase